MKLLLLLIVIASVAQGLPTVNEIHGDLPRLKDTRIVGGEEAEDGEFPWQISILHKPLFEEIQHLCGGSILSEHYVITTASCIRNYNANKLTVVAGTNKIFGNTTGEEQQVIGSSMIVHAHFDILTITNDIALIYMETPLVLNEKVQPVVLPEQHAFIADGTDCTVSGWGSLHENTGFDSPVMSDVLMKVTVPTVSDDKCRDSYEDMTVVIGDAMICAGVEAGGKDSCTGDSGGPMVCDGVLHGISIRASSEQSWNYGCARPDFPGIYTEIAYYRDWIDAHAV
ncbi:unnamed protein product [Meganyctiphanes norvegica]|uniref:Peptidase S1 domain-containing protein n=1 Tax=Meganyctiphanes norvegica TaxID=48144 RepID=A0AAV2SDK8_MEGNR